MADHEVAPLATKPTPSVMYTALRAGWRAILQTEPTRASVLVLLAHWGLETGNGAASRNWNVAGIKWTAGCGADFARYMTRERVNGAVIHVMQAFRAYATCEQGVADYLRELRHDFAWAWPAVEAGDVGDFAHRLKERRYYTDTEENYTAGLRAREAQLDAWIGPDTVPELPLSAAAIAQGTDPDGLPWPTKDA
jgi:hypothetical protein